MFTYCDESSDHWRPGSNQAATDSTQLSLQKLSGASVAICLRICLFTRPLCCCMLGGLVSQNSMNLEKHRLSVAQGGRTLRAKGEDSTGSGNSSRRAAIFRWSGRLCCYLLLWKRGRSYPTSPLSLFSPHPSSPLPFSLPSLLLSAFLPMNTYWTPTSWATTGPHQPTKQTTHPVLWAPGSRERWAMLIKWDSQCVIG